MTSETRYEKCVRRARNGYGCETEAEVKRVARHLFAKVIVDGATIGKCNGKLYVDRPAQPRPSLP